MTYLLPSIIFVAVSSFVRLWRPANLPAFFTFVYIWLWRSIILHTAFPAFLVIAHMSIPGVETARRRRASHGRSLLAPKPSHPFHPPLGYSVCKQPSNEPPLDFRGLTLHSGIPRSSTAPSSGSGQFVERDVRQKLAIAARNRLHERLRAADSFKSYRPSISTASSGFRFQQNPRLRGEVFTPKIQSKGSDCEEDDCPVCIDRFISGQIVVILPCEHKFHRDCLNPWLEAHNHCPLCRANVSDKPLLKSLPS